MKLIFTLLTLFFSWSNVEAQTISLITNGDFSALGSSWTISSPYWWISSSFSCYSSPTGYAYVGSSSGTGANSTYGSMYQTVTIPSSATSALLTLEMSANTDETTTSAINDILEVQIRNSSMSLLYIFQTFSNLDASYPSTGCQSYSLHAYSIPSAYFGMPIRLNFQTASSASLPTRFRIDNINVTATVPCTYSLSPTTYTCPDASGSTYSGVSTLTAPVGCSWSALVTSGSSWLSTSSSGSGSGSISITVTANTGSTSRTGTISVGGTTLTVTQPGVGCTYSLSPTTYTCPDASGSTYSGVSTLTAPVGCSWSALVTSGSSWLSTSSSGSGSGSISITVTANTGTISRTGTINISGKILTIIQPGTLPITDCFPTGDDYIYPYSGEDCKGNCYTDDWNFCKFNCTSWVAWKINQASGHSTPPYPFKNSSVFGIPTYLSHAVNWNAALRNLGYSVNNIPAVGSIAYWFDHGGGVNPGEYGHVAFVNCVSANLDTVTLTEYNFSPPCKHYSPYRKVILSKAYQAGNRKPDSFIHIESVGFGGGTIIGNTEIRKEISVYPNPSTGNITVELKNVYMGHDGIIVIFNTLGQAVRLKKITEHGNNTFDLSDLSNGIYYVQLKTELHNLFCKFEVLR